MATGTFLSRILGLVREQVLAAVFGASASTDVFFVAYRLPNLFRDLLAEGAFSAAFVPNFIQAKKNSPQGASNLFSSIFLLLMGISGLVAGLLALFAPELVALFAPEFTQDIEKYQLAIDLTRLMAGFLVCVSGAALMTGVLNTYHSFFIPALSPVAFNIVLISAMLVLPAFFVEQGIEPLFALGWGVLVGGLFQFLFQIPFVLKKGISFSLSGPRHPLTKKVIMMLGPGLLGFAATQLNLLVNTILATSSVVGAVSWLNYAFRLFQLPVGILSVSLGNVHLVHFGEAWKNNDKERAGILLREAVELSFFLLFPSLVVLFCLAYPLTSVIFERGQFSLVDSNQTALALQCYALGLPFYGLYKILVPSCYSVDRERIPVYASIAGISYNIVASWLMVPHLGFQVLALNTSLSMFINVVIQFVVLKRIVSFPWKTLFSLRLFKMVAALLPSLSLYFYKKDFFEFIFRQTFQGLGEQIGMLVLAGAAVLGSYLCFLILMGERKFLKSFFSKRA